MQSVILSGAGTARSVVSAEPKGREGRVGEFFPHIRILPSGVWTYMDAPALPSLHSMMIKR